jgi:hypothetical protein
MPYRLSLLLLAVLVFFARLSAAQNHPAPGDVWFVAKATDQDNNLIFITANRSYENYAHKSEHPWCLAINIPTVKQNRNGHPTDEEAVILNATQDIITNTLQQAGAVQYVGRVTVKGHREVYYYVADPEKMNAALTKLAKKRQPRAWEYQMKQDRKWERVALFFQAPVE